LENGLVLALPLKVDIRMWGRLQAPRDKGVDNARNMNAGGHIPKKENRETKYSTLRGFNFERGSKNFASQSPNPAHNPYITQAWARLVSAFSACSSLEYIGRAGSVAVIARCFCAMRFAVGGGECRRGGVFLRLCTQTLEM
jgi:hypothetical protein